MPKLLDASPQISIHLYKTISRETVDGQAAVSSRYKGKEEYIDLTPFLSEGSSVRTSKSVREPAGAFSITFADRPNNSMAGALASGSLTAIESVYGLIEPMDMVEIRMWGGAGPKPAILPIKMRGFVSDVQRSQAMGQDGRPQRQVTITGHDYGKIWQIYQVIYLQAYSEGEPLLTTYRLSELFGLKVENVMKSGEFVQSMIQKVINPFISNFIPANSPMPKEIKVSDSISVAHGMVNLSYQEVQGAIYDFLRFHADVGVWSELYTEDREDGVHLVYRPTPALKISKSVAEQGGEKDRKIQSDAPDPIVVAVPDSKIKNITASRSDGNVANFFWVRNSRFDLIDDMQRKLSSLPAENSTVSMKDYPNSARKYYGTRAMYAETQQGDDEITNMLGGQAESDQIKRSHKQLSWLEKRRLLMIEMNKDNIVLERGAAVVKGGPMRPDGSEAMKAGDYAKFQTGQLEYVAYVTQIDDEFLPFQSYTTTLTYERGEGFVARAKLEGGAQSPWLYEQATRR